MLLALVKLLFDFLNHPPSGKTAINGRQDSQSTCGIIARRGDTLFWSYRQQMDF
jgi:hypothetical protein